jgi:hypothetical protein
VNGTSVGLARCPHRRGAVSADSSITGRPAKGSSADHSCAPWLRDGGFVWTVGLACRCPARAGRLSDLAAACVPFVRDRSHRETHAFPAASSRLPRPYRVFGLTAAVEHNRCAMLRSLAGMAILFTSYLIIARAARDGCGVWRLSSQGGPLGRRLTMTSWAPSSSRANIRRRNRSSTRSSIVLTATPDGGHHQAAQPLIALAADQVTDADRSRWQRRSQPVRPCPDRR